MPNTNGHGHMPLRVALYLRVSSEEQRDREIIEIQREFLEQYCRLYGLEIAGEYADDGVSGTVPLHERPDGRRLLEDAQEGRFTAVLVSKLDRLGRSLLVIVDAHDRLDAARATLRSGREPIDTSNPSGRLIFQMLASFAEYDRENIRERTQAGLHRAFRRGKYMGRIPYGYRANADAHLEVVEEEAEIVREIISNIADGATLYAEAKRLNDSGIPAPGTRYGTSERKPGRLWQSKTLSNIVHQSAYIGVHCVKINGGEEVIEREVPIILENTSIRNRAVAALSENRRYRNRKNDRRYLLAGLVKCAHCGYGCSGHATWSKGKRYSYYVCIAKWPEKTPKASPHKPPYVKAEWLEKTVWDDVRFFLENPGEVLERVREQMGDEDEAEKLERRRGDLGKRLAGKQAEKDRYVRLYAQGHISEDELSVYLADLKNQIGNLRLLLESVEADLSQHAQKREIAETTSTWLATLRERISEIEAETDEAFQARRQLVKLLVEEITVDRKEDGSSKIEITYRFGPPSEAAGERDTEEMFVGSTQNALSYSFPQTSHWAISIFSSKTGQVPNRKMNTLATDETNRYATGGQQARHSTSPRPSDTLRALETHREADMEEEQVPGSWVGQRVRIITIVTADRTAQEEATLLNLDQVGITVSREELVGGGEEIVFHPWAHVYQLGPLVG